jgi:hypothetical protein
MDIYNILTYTVCILWVAVVCMSFIVFIPRAYIFVFEHNIWKLWRYYIKNYDKFEYCHTNTSLLSHVFELPGTDIRAFIWFDEGYPVCSIHDREGCLLGRFDKYHSKKMSKLLLRKVKV